MTSREVPTNGQIPVPLAPPAMGEGNVVASAARNAAIAARGTVVESQRALRVHGKHAPTALACLNCQLIGRRRLTCSRADVCAELPHSFALGPVLLGGWLVTAIAFIIAIM